jgi:hypothetical protein
MDGRQHEHERIAANDRHDHARAGWPGCLIRDEQRHRPDDEWQDGSRDQHPEAHPVLVHELRQRHEGDEHGADVWEDDADQRCHPGERRQDDQQQQRLAALRDLAEEQHGRPAEGAVE